VKVKVPELALSRALGGSAAGFVLEVLVSPLANCLNDGFGASSVLAERVFDSWWHLWIDAAVDQARRLELAQGAGEHLVGDIGDQPL